MTIFTACYLLFFADAFAEVILGTVIAVHDGDTITLRTESNKKKIRLAGIDAPELKQPYGVESRSLLREAVLDKSVLVETSRIDKYGRAIGKVILDGQDINLKQIQSGGAWVYRAYLKELSKEDRAAYLEAEAESKTNAVGLWKDSNPVEPWIWRKK
ncbi:MAG: thermonuclease family protein [Polynucleobacter sp.]|nr:thermonuclease family protein [Polynucleobacter sp.]